MAKKSDASDALGKIINRIENQHRCKAVYHVHADRAQELTGDRHRAFLENQGITVTFTAGYDSNANGRAERAVLYFFTKGANPVVIKYQIGEVSGQAKFIMDICSARCRRSPPTRSIW